MDGQRAIPHTAREVSRRMVQKAPIVQLPAEPQEHAPAGHEPERLATIWVSRITGLVSALFVLLALAVWEFRHGHYRLVLGCLVIAMFAAILHSYTFENGH
jgi:hypothetical protein